MRTAAAAFMVTLAAGACSQPAGPVPSLSPRAAEAIDPRVPVETAPVAQNVEAALALRLADLVAQARQGDAAFRDAAAVAERMIAVAGAPQGESWVVAQQALTVAVAARAPTTKAIGDIDQLAASAIAERGWIPPAEQAAIAAASEQVSAIANEQAARIDAMRARLGG